MNLRREFLLYCPTYNGYWYAVRNKKSFVKPTLTDKGFVVDFYTPYTLDGVMKKGVELGKQGYNLEVHHISNCMEIPELTKELNERIRKNLNYLDF